MEPKPLEAANAISKFAYRGLSALAELEYRPMSGVDDLEELYRFRYKCYRDKGYISENAYKQSHDKMDETPGVMRFGIYHDNTIVSSIRLHYVDKANPNGPSRLVYPEIIGPMIEQQDYKIVDPSRLTTDPTLKREMPMLPFLTVRLAAMASIHFNVDYCFSTVRTSHIPFYKRVIEAKLIRGERYYAGLDFPVNLCASHVPSTRHRVFARYPFFHSLPHERRMLFGNAPNTAEQPLTVLPTARWAKGF